MFSRQQQIVIDNSKPFEDYQQQQNNYDMTILHMNIDDDDNDDEDLIFATKSSTNQKKQIPQWARSKFKILYLILLIFVSSI